MLPEANGELTTLVSAPLLPTVKAPTSEPPLFAEKANFDLNVAAAVALKSDNEFGVTLVATVPSGLSRVSAPVVALIRCV